MPPFVDPKGSIKVRPKAEPKTGFSDETCARLDVCAPPTRSPEGEQKGFKRVRTIDSVDKGKRAGLPWVPLRPPSVCPPPRPPTPNEIETGTVESLVIAEANMRGNRERAPTVERVALLREKSPKGPMDDCAGIYRRLTGTSSRASGGSEGDGCAAGGVTVVAIDGGVRRELGQELGEGGGGSGERNPSVDWIA